MSGYGASLHGLLGHQGESPREKDVDPSNFQQLLRQLRDQSVTQGDVAALRQEMLTLRMVVNVAKTEMSVQIEQEVGEALGKERAERAHAERLLEKKLALLPPQLHAQQEDVEKLKGQEKKRFTVCLMHGATTVCPVCFVCNAGCLESHAQTVQESIDKLASDVRRDSQDCAKVCLSLFRVPRVLLLTNILQALEKRLEQLEEKGGSSVWRLAWACT